MKPRSKKTAINTSQLEKAVKAYQLGQYTSIRKCADVFAVPYTTLWGRVAGGRITSTEAHREQQLLSPAEERTIVQWIEDQDYRGFPLRVEMAVYLAQRVLDTGTKAKTVGKHWVSRFLNRHPHLCTKFATQIQIQRVLANDPAIVKDCFQRLQPIIKKRKIIPKHIYNMDEKGFQMGIGSS